MDVALVHWPVGAPLRETLHLAGLPRLLLLGDDSGPPPAPVDDLEDWIRLPVSDDDLRARVDWLRQRATIVPSSISQPCLSEDGLLTTDLGWASLPPVEVRLVTAFLDRFGEVVSRESLAQAAWHHRTTAPNTLDVHVLRLRRRLVPVGLVIRTARSRGYALTAGGP